MPVIVIVLEPKDAITPAGSPVGVPMPVAPPVAMVILGDIAVLTHTIGLDDGAPAVLDAITVIVPVAFTLPQPPVNGML